MGLLETILAKLESIEAKLSTGVAPVAAAVQEVIADMQQQALPTATATAATTATATPVNRVSVATAAELKAYFDAGNQLTGNEIDAQGCYWSEKINTKVPAMTQKCVWKRGKGVDEAVYDAEIARIKADVAATSSTVEAVPTTAAPAVTAPSMPAVPGIPVPGAAAPASLPLPGIGAAAPAAKPFRRQCVEATNVLDKKYGIEFDTISIVFSELGSPTGMFIDLPDSATEQCFKVLNGWAINIDNIEEADAAVKSMNGNDPTYLIQLMDQMQLGTRELATVDYRNLYRLYQAVHGYQNVLEKHFGKPVTPIKPDPMV